MSLIVRIDIRKVFAATVANIRVRGKRDGAKEFGILTAQSAHSSRLMDMVGERIQEA
jgi:hypothetical protein